MINQNFKDQLKQILNCDIKALYPLARELNRKLYFYVGPTNSGKTHKAMQEMISADTGTYLAPLRLLALENYESLISNNTPASLVTGEEEIFDEDAGHICSTIEMINFNLEVDVCVIDEVQMLADEDRGWAWVNAILGSPASKVIMTGSVNALDIVKKIASYLGEELEIVRFKRKNPLQVLEKQISLRDIEPSTALIAFSRKDVLALKSKLSKYHKVSVLYGNLSPEVRKEEAKRFRNGDSDILVATDAIAMGLNLPIKTLLFTTDTKFDGISKRKLLPNEVIQIAGRAGRYGHHEIGHIGGTTGTVLKHIEHMFTSPMPTIKPPVKVKATASQVEELSVHLNTKSLTKILKYFSKHMKYDGPFEAVNIKTMIELAAMLDQKKSLSLEDKYMLSSAPINTRSPLILNGYKKYVNNILNHTVTKYRPSTKTSGVAKTQLELLQAEDEVKKISLYLWLSYKLPELFPDKQKAEQFRIELNYFCENSLKSNKTLKPMQRRGGNRNQNRNRSYQKDGNRSYNSRSDQNPRRRTKNKDEQNDSRDSETSRNKPRRRSRRGR
ncbi:MAG: helicase-related protein [Campylobacterota bacterium]|nr:helicase-related protein [Campylobacterota bacterium]